MFRSVHFQGFPRLASLFLRSVAISQDELEALITSCPLLNKLCLIDMFDSGGPKVCSPSLVNLTFVGEHIDPSFENVPLLATLSVSLTVESDKYYAAPGVICKLFRFLYHLPSIKKIVLGGQAFKSRSGHMAHFVMQVDHGKPVEKFWNSQQSFDCLFSHLRSLKITGVNCILELPFLKFVLANAPVLETACIGFDYRLKTGLDITSEMIKFRRLSPAAKIKILKRKFLYGLVIPQNA